MLRFSVCDSHTAITWTSFFYFLFLSFVVCVYIYKEYSSSFFLFRKKSIVHLLSTCWISTPLNHLGSSYLHWPLCSQIFFPEPLLVKVMTPIHYFTCFTIKLNGMAMCLPGPHIHISVHEFFHVFLLSRVTKKIHHISYFNIKDEFLFLCFFYII